MAKTQNRKNVTLTEEREAAVLEQIRPTKPISASLMKQIERVHEINEILAPYKAEIEEIRAKAFKEMDNKGVDVLTRKGVPIVSRDMVNGEEWDKDAIKQNYPEIVMKFVHEKVSFRINWKKRVKF